MKSETRSSWREGAIETVESWRKRGCEFASIVDGVPIPWDRAPVQLVMRRAKRRGLKVLSLAEPAHLELILAAILSCSEFGVDRPTVVRGGSA